MSFNSHKSTFWSQLLLSMLAIFVLPVSQDVNYENLNANYQNQQQAQSEQQIARLIASLTEQGIQQPQFPSAQANVPQKLEEKTPHFASSFHLLVPPIRAGPNLFC